MNGTKLQRGLINNSPFVTITVSNCPLQGASSSDTIAVSQYTQASCSPTTTDNLSLYFLCSGNTLTLYQAVSTLTIYSGSYIIHGYTHGAATITNGASFYANSYICGTDFCGNSYVSTCQTQAGLISSSNNQDIYVVPSGQYSTVDFCRGLQSSPQCCAGVSSNANCPTTQTPTTQTPTTQRPTTQTPTTQTPTTQTPTTQTPTTQRPTFTIQYGSLSTAASSCCLGPSNTQTIGQLFALPTGASQITSFTLWINSFGIPFNTAAYIYQWDGENKVATGSPLFYNTFDVTCNILSPYSSSFNPISLNFGQYIAFFTVVGTSVGNSQQAEFGYANGVPTGYPGYYQLLNNMDSTNCFTNVSFPWRLFNTDGPLLFTATFQ